MKYAFAACFLLILLGIRIFSYQHHNVSNYADGQFLAFETTLQKEPQKTGAYQTFYANAGDNGETQEILIKTSKFPEFHYGSTVRVSGTIKRQVLKKDEIVIAMFFPKIEAVQNREKNGFSLIKNVLALTSFIRQKVTSLFQETLPPTSSSLLLGIVFGFKESLPRDLAVSLKTVGVVHVIAASGMNVTLVASFLAGIFTIFFKRQIALFLCILGICFYALLAGLEASIVRASIMGVIVFSAQILGRQTLAIYSLGVAGYLMILISPDIISDLGFQLSFTSTLGILYLKPLFGKKELLLIDDVKTTVSAQIATFPILFFTFGTYSFWSIIVNGLLLWTIPILMVLGGLGAICGAVFEPLGKVFLYLSLPFLILFEKTAEFFSNLPGLINLGLDNSEIIIPWQLGVGYYLVLIAMIIFLYKRRNRNMNRLP